MQCTSALTLARAATLALVAWTLVPAADAAAQCHVVSMPAAFDPPGSGLPPHLRPSANSIGISASTQRLVVRYNYGYVTYSLATPSAPFATAIKDLWQQDGYPKNGDGQSRTGLVALSADGQRVLVPWTDDMGYGTIAQPYGIAAFGHGGDFPPPGYSASESAVARVGSRYLGFTTTNQGLFAADVTNLPTAGASVKNGIPSERVSGPPNDLTGATAVDTAARSWVVTWSPTRVWVLDVTNAGPSVPGLTTGIVKREHLATTLGVTGGGTVASVSAAAHPADGALHLLVEGARFSGTLLSTGVRLFRIDPDTGNPTEVGGFAPPTGEWPQAASVLLPFDSEVVAFVVHRMSTGGLKLQIRSSRVFTTNLAATVPVFATPGVVNAMKGFRSSGPNAHLYIGDALKTWALSLSCTLPVDPGGTPPTVTGLTFSPSAPGVGENVTVACVASDGTWPIESYRIELGDGAIYTGSSPSTAHAWAEARDYLVTCRAYDSSGLSGELAQPIVVHAAPYELTVNTIGSGSGLVTSTPPGLSCEPACSVSFPGGDPVTLEAASAAGSRFAGWSGAGCAGTGPCIVTMAGARAVTAVFLPEGGASMSPVTPCRVADTRTGGGVPLAAGEVRELPVVATGCNLPADAIAATMNVTVTQTAAAGFVSVFPAGSETPVAQTVSFGAGRTRASAAVVLLGTSGGVRVHNASEGPLHVILDVSGVFR